MIDDLILLSGLARAPEELPDGSAIVLKDVAEAFLRAGGTLSLSDWAALSADSQAAFIAASNFIWRERCAMIGLAMQGPAQAAAVADDEAGRDVEARLAVDKLAHVMESKKP